MGHALWDFAYASIFNLWSLGSAISTLAGIIGFIFRRYGSGTMNAAPLNRWPTVLWIGGWLGSLLFLWLACFQAWEEKNSALIALKNEHPSTTLGEIHEEVIDKKNPDKYTNIDIDVFAEGVTGAAPQLVSICQVRDNYCDKNFSFDYNRQIGWRKGTSSDQPIVIAGKEQVVPIIIANGHASVYFVGKNGKREPDAGCKWCDDIPVGTYHLQVQIKANNSFEIGCYIFNWIGKVERSTVLKRPCGN